MLKHSIFALCLCLFALAGCQEERVPHGTAAVVNGELIPLSYVQLIMDSTTPYPSVSDAFQSLRVNYGEALSTAIALTLARQEMSKRGYDASVEASNLAESLGSDLGDVQLPAYLLESVIPAEDWQKLTADRLAMNAFVEQVLQPDAHVSPDEIQQYYSAYRERFTLGPNYLLCFFADEELRRLEEWCSALHGESQAAGALCGHVYEREVPEEWLEAVRGTRAGSCAKPVQTEGLWRTIAVLGHDPERQISAAEAFPLLEEEIKGRKLDLLLDSWLESALAASEIRLTPEMAACLWAAKEAAIGTEND